MIELLVALLLQASEITGLPLPGAVVPNVVMLSQCELVRAFEGDPKAPCEFEDGRLMVAAFYDMESNTVVLNEHWSAESLEDQSILFHELVHFLQDMNNQHFCVEQLAYDSQMEWLRRQGVAEPMEFLGLDAFTLNFLTTCHHGR